MSARAGRGALRIATAALTLTILAGCGGDDAQGGGAGSTAPLGGTTAPSATAGMGGSGAAGAAGSSAVGTAGATAGTGVVAAGAGGAGGTDATAGTTSPGPVPASCGAAPRAYTLAATMLDASFVPEEVDRFWGGAAPRTPVAVNPESGLVHVGFTRAQGTGRSVVIAAEGGAPADAIEIADAAIGGVAVTSDGVGALLFDPNSDVDARMWAAVARYRSDGTQVFTTDLFRSPNLDDEGTKGAPSSGRLGYVPGTDQLVAYFGHTQRYDDGVRHQGGYLATLSASGMEDRISGWFGSHNLDQRLFVDGARVAVLGLGDAYPKGIFFSYLEDAETNVIYRLAADGVGTTNGQLGGMIDAGDQILTPFITNRSVAQDLDAGTWPDIDDGISMQIRDAAAAGTDLGLLSVPKASLAAGDLAPVWIEVAVGSGARLGSLKAAKYGSGELILLAWAESTGSQRNSTSVHYTLLIAPDGAICQPKTQLDAAYAFTPGDDLVSRPDGSVVWANVQGARVQIVTLTP